MRTLELVAKAVLVGLGVLAVLVVARLGFLGLVLAGVAVILVCTLTTLNDDVPTWGVEVFRARMQRRRAEQLMGLAFYRWCGIVLLAVGVLGLALTWWG